MDSDPDPLKLDDSAHYRAAVSEGEAFIRSLGPALRNTIAPYFAELVKGEFTQVVVLLPSWLDDLLPVSVGQLHDLAVAHLYGWWYYDVQDRLLDGQGTPELLLGGHLALVRMLEMYRKLGLHRTPCWSELMKMMATSAERYAQECATHFNTVSELSPHLLAPWTANLVIQRGAPFYFNTMAQLYLAGHDPHGALRQDLVGALQSFTLARQLADDTSDWPGDLVAGRLNLISARLMQRLYERGLARSGVDLDVHRLIGYQATDEPFWDMIETDYHAAAADALALLDRNGARRFGHVLRHQVDAQRCVWHDLRSTRVALRELFSLDAIEG